MYDSKNNHTAITRMVQNDTQNGIKLYRMVQNGTEWYRMTNRMATRMVQNGIE